MLCVCFLLLWALFLLTLTAITFSLVLSVREAAIVLGFNEVIWDQGLEIEELDVFWDELTPEKQIAAALLGYDKIKWNSS